MCHKTSYFYMCPSCPARWTIYEITTPCSVQCGQQVGDLSFEYDQETKCQACSEKAERETEKADEERRRLMEVWLEERQGKVKERKERLRSGGGDG